MHYLCSIIIALIMLWSYHSSLFLSDTLKVSFVDINMLTNMYIFFIRKGITCTYLQNKRGNLKIIKNVKYFTIALIRRQKLVYSMACYEATSIVFRSRGFREDIDIFGKQKFATYYEYLLSLVSKSFLMLK